MAYVVKCEAMYEQYHIHVVNMTSVKPNYSLIIFIYLFKCIDLFTYYFQWQTSFIKYKSPHRHNVAYVAK